MNSENKTDSYWKVVRFVDSFYEEAKHIHQENISSASEIFQHLNKMQELAKIAIDRDFDAPSVITEEISKHYNYARQITDKAIKSTESAHHGDLQNLYKEIRSPSMSVVGDWPPFWLKNKP
jgi:hypothetical protein